METVRISTDTQDAEASLFVTIGRGKPFPSALLAEFESHLRFLHQMMNGEAPDIEDPPRPIEVGARARVEAALLAKIGDPQTAEILTELVMRALEGKS